jgi:hypothetical protein
MDVDQAKANHLENIESRSGKRRRDVRQNWETDSHVKWSIDRNDMNSRYADCSHGYATLVGCRQAMDAMHEDVTR